MTTWLRFALVAGLSTGFLSMASLHADNENPGALPVRAWGPGAFPNNANVGTYSDSPNPYNWTGSVFYTWNFDSVTEGAGSGYDQWVISNLATSGTPELFISIAPLNLGAGNTFDENTGDGSQGNGYWFMDVIKVTGGGNLSELATPTISALDANIDGGSWTAYYGDTGLSLYYYAGGNNNPNFSVVPEPSTYFMVSGLLALPAWRACRRFRRKRTDADNSAEVETV